MAVYHKVDECQLNRSCRQVSSLVVDVVAFPCNGKKKGKEERKKGIDDRL